MTVANTETGRADETAPEAHVDVPSRVCYFVLGMHRSGTSSVAGTLVKLGVAAPAHLLGANEGNETGHWESQPLIAFHDELLASAGSRWDDWRAFNSDWYDTSVAAQFKERANRLLDEEFGDAPLFVFKDPRNCRLARFWLEIFAERGIAPKIVLSIRSPLEVARSHQARDGFPLRTGLLLWLRHTLDAEAASRDLPRTVIEWDAFLSDWPSAVATMENTLGAFPANTDLAAAEIDRFLRNDLKHQRVPQEELGRNALMHAWVEQAYTAICELAHNPDSHGALSVLDQIRAQFEEAAALFGGALADVEARAAESEQAVTKAQSCSESLRAQLAELASELEMKQRVEEELRQASQNQLIEHQRDAEAALHQALNELSQRHQIEISKILSSRSWKLTAPLRRTRTLAANIRTASRRTLGRIIRQAWRTLPVSTRTREILRTGVFSAFPLFFRNTASYRAWLLGREIAPISADDFPADYPAVRGPVAISKARPPEKHVKFVAFYLPQFHPIPENDEWWGKGFTEWTNVRAALPQFPGHHQPNVPGELGYYDLREPWVFKRQVELAKLYGIHAFCFYFYWFGGKRLLEKPLEMWLSDPSLDLDFCVCWANENWSRRWDGLESEILIAQDHSPEDDLAFIQEVAPFLRDPRNIRIDGRPLLLVYRPSLLPSAAETASRWRKWCRENGIGEIYLAYTQSFDSMDPKELGFDAAVEFPPNVPQYAPPPPSLTKDIVAKDSGSRLRVWDWRYFLQKSRRHTRSKYRLFRGVNPGWDNTPRRKDAATVFLHNSPALFEEWLLNAARDTIETVLNPDARLVFINAWNEWAEGAYLEPDTAAGYANLQAVRNTLDILDRQGNSVLLITHDALPHGAQYLARELGRTLKNLGKTVNFVALRGGDLLPGFARIGDTFLAEGHSASERLAHYENLYASGVHDAIVNTVVSGSELRVLKDIGFRTVSLIHEMPGIIRIMSQEGNAEDVARYADTVVFPALSVQEGFELFAKIDPAKVLIRPQGLLRSNPYKGEKMRAREIVLDRLALDHRSRLVLAMAFFQERKGLDLLVKAAASIIRIYPDAQFVIVGQIAPDDYRERILLEIRKQCLDDHFHFLNHEEDPFAFFAGADVFALPSREDPFPNVVLESAEVGVPVVAFREATGAASFIEEQGGALATAFDTEEYAKRIVELLESGQRSSAARPGSMTTYALDLLHTLNGTPRISVIVPNYNYARLMRERLTSIKNQTYPIYQLVILDDASTDDSRKVIEDLLVELELDAVTVWNETNSGSVFRQWQKGLELCTGDYVWIAEADDSSEPQFLQTLASSLFADETITLAYAQSRAVDADGHVSMHDYLDYTNDISHLWHRDYVIDGKRLIAEAMVVKNVIPNVSATLMRRDALVAAVKEVEEDLPRYRVGGDWLVYLQILTKGKVSYTRRVLNIHRRHSASVTTDAHREKHFAEIVELQERAEALVEPTAEAKQKAADYRVRLRKHFRFDDEREAVADA